MLTLFSSNTRNTNDANLLGSPCGKNCLYIFMKPCGKTIQDQKQRENTKEHESIGCPFDIWSITANLNLNGELQENTGIDKLIYILALLVSHLGSLLKIPYTLKIEKLN